MEIEMRNICKLFEATSQNGSKLSKFHRLAKSKLIWQFSLYILSKFHWRKILVKLNSNFFAERSALATFCLAQKGW